MDEKLQKKLRDRKENGTLRSLTSTEGMIDFASNDYLGCSKHGNIGETEKNIGATGSRLISGNSAFIEEVERDMAAFFDAEAGLCFNSGYDANIGIFSSIPQRGGVVLYDEFIHASARDGIRLSHAKAFSFKHNDVADVRRLLEKHLSQTVYIAIESLYSMHGDFCPLLEFTELAETFGAYLILDEAHSAGVFGKDGRGFAHALNFHSNCFIRLVTFGKAYGCHGAIVLSSGLVRDYLINFARSFIYTTALPESAYRMMMEAVKMKDMFEERKKLMRNIGYFRSKIGSAQLISASNSPIQFMRFEDLGALKRIEIASRNKHIFTKAIFSPTVAEGQEGLRISLHSFNTQLEIDHLIESISV